MWEGGEGGKSGVSGGRGGRWHQLQHSWRSWNWSLTRCPGAQPLIWALSLARWAQVSPAWGALSLAAQPGRDLAGGHWPAPAPRQTLSLQSPPHDAACHSRPPRKGTSLTSSARKRAWRTEVAKSMHPGLGGTGPGETALRGLGPWEVGPPRGDTLRTVCEKDQATETLRYKGVVLPDCSS